MKVIYSTFSRLGGTGLSNVAFHAAKALYQQGNLVKVITYGNCQNIVPNSLIKIIRFQPAKIFSMLSSRYYYSMKRMWLDWRAAAYINSHKCDIFHGWSHECLHSLKAAKRQGALTIIDRGNTHPRFNKYMLDEEYAIYGISRKLDQAPRWLKPFDSLRRELEEAVEEFELADYVFVNSQFCYDTFVDEGYPKEKLVMIPRGFEVTQYQPLPKKDNKFRAIFVGQLCVRKGLKYLLEAWDKLNLPDAELILVGHLHEELEALMKPYSGRKDIVRWGFVPDPVKLYNSATVFVLPTIEEGSAKVTYEAMACGIPVIVTPNAGSLARDGKDGFIVPIRQVEPLMEKILYFYNNREAAVEMGREARRYIETYTWEHYERTLIETYQALLDLRHPKQAM